MWPGMKSNREKRRGTKGAFGNNGLDNTYSLTRWRKEKKPGESLGKWAKRKQIELMKNKPRL